jgi:N-6 DNA Methylase
MRQFEEYVQHLQNLVQAPRVLGLDELDHALDGQPATALRRLVPLEILRADGAFFSGEKLARRLVQPLVESINNESVVLDPACGAGDLLVAIAQHLQIRRTLSHTLDCWGAQLAGRDIHPEFVAATIARIALAAMRRGAKVDRNGQPAASRLVDVLVGSGLDDTGAYARATHVVVNPPFNMMPASPGCSWVAGSVNTAAVFLERVIDRVRPGTHVAAILPDVLRSGARYARWRALVESRLCIRRVEVVGQFAPQVDVDVFMLVGEVVSTASSLQTPTIWHGAREACERIGDLFDVSVGALVPYRDRNRGPWRPVVAPASLPPWETVRRVDTRRRFAGRVEQGPFVAVRRTSRPGDRARAVATILAVKESVVVENHVLVLRPHDGTLRSCKRLLTSLRRPETTEWLDMRIRCRHLTVGAVRELPIWDETS